MDKVLVSIAGYDPSGGAGVLLDIAVFRRLGFPGGGLLTAVTAQNSRTVAAVRCLGGSFLYRQYETLVQDVGLAGIKVGMLGGPGNIAALGRILANHEGLPVVVDPVFRSSSGRWLLDKKAVPSYLDKIKGRITLLTPNLDEASLIFGRRLRKPVDMKEAARKIVDLVAAPCLIKGGHLAGKAEDVLYDGRRFFLFPHKRIAKDVHGTGCFLSSSLLCYLVMKKSLVEACSLASEFTQAAMKKAVHLGKGRAIFLEF
ncbi:MAG TPA: hydroxymethylpyrimidine/phosphomethylpyrimidine kinase [Candidatus Desulfaltia sp.]|nr:hydroxymethylpyrimidine/phosphomethylpyrimidine kinase [Candidatus Desulfaltia sp.]